jgi:hypothetical protein
VVTGWKRLERHGAPTLAARQAADVRLDDAQTGSQSQDDYSAVSRPGNQLPTSWTGLVNNLRAL